MFALFNHEMDMAQRAETAQNNLLQKVPQIHRMVEEQATTLVAVNEKLTAFSTSMLESAERERQNSTKAEKLRSEKVALRGRLDVARKRLRKEAIRLRDARKTIKRLSSKNQSREIGLKRQLLEARNSASDANKRFLDLESEMKETKLQLDDSREQRASLESELERMRNLLAQKDVATLNTESNRKRSGSTNDLVRPVPKNPKLVEEPHFDERNDDSPDDCESQQEVFDDEPIDGPSHHDSAEEQAPDAVTDGNASFGVSEYIAERANDVNSGTPDVVLVIRRPPAAVPDARSNDTRTNPASNPRSPTALNFSIEKLLSTDTASSSTEPVEVPATHQVTDRPVLPVATGTDYFAMINAGLEPEYDDGDQPQSSVAGNTEPPKKPHWKTLQKARRLQQSQRLAKYRSDKKNSANNQPTS